MSGQLIDYVIFRLKLDKSRIEIALAVLRREFLSENVTTKKNAAAVALGRRGGLKGGKARAAKLSAEERQQIARKAANARWTNRTTEDERL